MSSLAYFFKQSLQGFARNLSTTLGSIITIFLSLFIIGVFLVGAIVVDNIVKSVESEVSITAYISDDAKQNQIDAAQKYIQGLDGVSNVTFTSKPIHGGSWTLVDVGAAAPQDLAWTVNAEVAGMSVVKTVSPARVAIEVLPTGTFLIFR
jgi:hypothetical protein